MANAGDIVEKEAPSVTVGGMHICAVTLATSAENLQKVKLNLPYDLGVELPGTCPKEDILHHRHLLSRVHCLPIYKSRNGKIKKNEENLTALQQIHG